MNNEQFDRIVAAVYDAAFGRSRWDQALDGLARVFDCWSVCLAGVSPADQSLRFIHTAGVRPDVIVTYLKDWHARNPHVSRLCDTPVDRWFHCHQQFDDGFVADSPFYQQFLIPAGARYTSACKLRDTDGLMVTLSLTRPVGAQPLGAAELPVLERLRHHLCAALDIEAHVRSHRSEMRAGRTLLAQWSQPVLLVDAQGAVRFTNPAADRLMGVSDAVGVRQGRIVCRNPVDERQLASAIRALDLERDGGGAGGASSDVLALNSASAAKLLADQRAHDAIHASPDAPRVPLGLSPSAGLYVKLRAAGEPAGVFVLPIRPSDTLSAFGGTPLAMVLFHRPAAQVRLEPFVLAQTFGLTPAETRVGVLLAQGLSPDEVTGELHVSMATVRSHIKSLLAKTGTNRQPDLVRVLSALADILLPRPGEMRMAA